MPVFNTAANIRPQDPVGDYYEGKALRANISAREKSNEILQQQIDADLPAAEVRQGDEALELRRKEYNASIAKSLRELDADTQEQYIKGSRSAKQWFLEHPGDNEGATRQFALGSGLDPDEVRKEFGLIEEHEADALMASEDFELGAEDVPSDYTLGKGRYSGKTNQLIAGIAPSEGGEDKPSARDQKIEDAARMLDGDVDTATKIVDGHIEMRQNEKTGMIELMDKITGEAWEVPLSYDEVPTAAPSPGRTLWDLSGHATGPISAIKAVGNIPAAWVGLKTATKVTQARQTFRTTGQNFIRALAINPKFPVGEQERIREEIALVPAVFDHPTLMRDRMVSLSGDLRLRMDQALNDSKNTGLPEATRKAQSSNANEIKNFLAVMGVPDATAEAPDYVTGEDRDLWGAFTEEDRKKLYPQYGEQ